MLLSYSMWLDPEIEDSDVKIVTKGEIVKRITKKKIIRIDTSWYGLVSLLTPSLWSSVDQTSPSTASAPCRHENLPHCHGLHPCYCNTKITWFSSCLSQLSYTTLSGLRELQWWKGWGTHYLLPRQHTRMYILSY